MSLGCPMTPESKEALRNTVGACQKDTGPNRGQYEYQNIKISNELQTTDEKKGIREFTAIIN